MVGTAAVFPIVIVIARQVAVNAVGFEEFGHGVVKWFHRSPTGMQKVVSAGMQFPAGRHAGHAADITNPERHGFFQQT